jgi:hypothetical protein
VSVEILEVVIDPELEATHLQQEMARHFNNNRLTPTLIDTGRGFAGSRGNRHYVGLLRCQSARPPIHDPAG